MKNLLLAVSVSVLSLAIGLSLGGCGESSDTAPPAASKPETPKAPLIHKAALADWCGEHGVPESICTRCNASLIPAFEAKGDWCQEHGLPESQCFACSPELEAEFKALAPKSGG